MQFKFAALLALIGTAVAAPVEIAFLNGADPIKLTDCSSPAAHAKIDNISVQPNPPQKGITNLVATSGKLDKTITAGTYTVKVNAFGMTLDHSGSVCGKDVWKLPLNMGELRMDALECPDSGDFKFNCEIDVSSKAPSGKVTAEVSAVDQDGQELTCFRAELEI
eukprot:TRINITY_DN1186_c0_g1::TRINITY_DN1186_c0_g1_i1::g.17270::m.17270 TRINITY_DN1186_c0_g1::TRINITY_DN1186_c0_g1_i1::g.17270  ORF type:complete len:192 (+),score=53.98,sp/Q54YD2/Y8295_DICDI/30.30/6e-11,E1_DerP2_DerF2/PF02221.10/2.2e-13 TRINITY_DN1186_c0_g1_i1:87-578(+)